MWVVGGKGSKFFLYMGETTPTYWGTQDELRFLERIGTHRYGKATSPLRQPKDPVKLLRNYIESAKHRDWQGINKSVVINYAKQLLRNISKSS